MSINEELAQKLHKEEQARFNVEQEAKFDVDVAQKLQEELDIVERQRMAQVHQAARGFIDSEWDNILARIAAGEDFVQQVQTGEKFSEEDLPMKLVEPFNQRKKFFAQQRAKAKRNKPMTSAQQKGVKEIFENTMRRVQSFVPMGSELEIQKLKRACQEVLEEPAKRQKIVEASGSGEEQSAEKEKELLEEELQKLLVIVLVEEVYVEALQDFADMLKKFDRDELNDSDTLWKLQRKRLSIVKSTYDVDVGCQAVSRTIFRDGK
ncbi:hypothetical protein Tco_0727129 [Tanacetum coccineum]|uniref:Uncharacterized protein n=1 Tax=Tanacetum coccineum TaxID=301880 RepID=A0ABQ4YHJ5_9ASTR